MTVERNVGYLSWIGAYGLPMLALYVGFGRAFGREAARRLFGKQSQVDGAICFNNWGCCQAWQKWGWRWLKISRWLV